MQCERSAAREKRADVNPWLSGNTSGPRQGYPLLLVPSHRPSAGRRRAATSCEGSGGSSRGSSPDRRNDVEGWAGGRGGLLFRLCTARRLQYAQPAVQLQSHPIWHGGRRCSQRQDKKEAGARGSKGPPAAPGRTGGRDTQSPAPAGRAGATAGREGSGSAPGARLTPPGSPAEQEQRSGGSGGGASPAAPSGGPQPRGATSRRRRRTSELPQPRPAPASRPPSLPPP